MEKEVLITVVRNWLKKLLKGMEVGLMELRNEFPCDSALIQTVVILDYMDIVWIKEMKAGLFVVLKQFKLPEFE